MYMCFRYRHRKIQIAMHVPGSQGRVGLRNTCMSGLLRSLLVSGPRV